MAFLMEIALVCLALNGYHEARGEPPPGQEMVAHVVMNRVRDPRFPDTVCGVVKQRNQFSWYWDKVSDVPRDLGVLWTSFLTARRVLSGWSPDITGGSTHYHSRRVSPSWAKRLTRTMAVGNHVFYRRIR